MVREVILYGAGKRCRALCEILKWSDVSVVAVIDSDEKKWGKEISGYPIQPPKEAEKLQNVSVCITMSNPEAVEQIRRQYQDLFYWNSIKEIGFYDLILEIYRDHSKIRRWITEYTINTQKEETVLFDCYQGLVLGGVESWTMDICKALLSRGRKSTYIISDGGTYDIEEDLLGHIIDVDINHDMRFVPSSIWKLAEVILIKLPCKVVTCSTDEVMLAAYLVKCFYPDQIKIISVIHNSCEAVYDAYRDFRECTDIYIGVSQDIRNDMIQDGVAPELVYSMTCPFACKKTLVRSYTEDYDQPIRIGYAGRIDHWSEREHSQKRMDLLLKCIRILEQRKVNYMVELAGDGPGRPQMEQYMYEHNLNKRIRFLGRVKRTEISAFWHRQDICINLADYEGRSISIIEAMGNGAVPVVTETSGTREDITDGVNGYRVPVGDFVSAADRIEYLASHREYLRKMGESAHGAVYPKSLMEPHVNFWEEILFP
ncbi:MAG: glycosyltransferase [Lachnospiraceae bacterium]|jgi:glycosyltransferase involved in cell wall biosynthesis|nr:glycosyltransferase [Lachnospiraceae bacterium]